MKYAVIDVETSGIVDYTKPADDPSQPRLASLGIVMLYEDMTTQAEHEFYVRPDGWEMTAEATAVNGLTTEFLRANGEHVITVLTRYRTLIDAGYAIAAYGAQSDCKILRGECRRAGLYDMFEKTKNVCLMRACLPLKMPKANGKGGWPKLEDACRFFGLEPEPKPHTALNGARCAAGVLRALSLNGPLPAAKIHYAKGKPVLT